jgi:hypothetical protein
MRNTVPVYHHVSVDRPPLGLLAGESVAPDMGEVEVEAVGDPPPPPPVDTSRLLTGTASTRGGSCLRGQGGTEGCESTPIDAESALSTQGHTHHRVVSTHLGSGAGGGA